MFSLDKRPKTLEEIVGQNKIVQEFINRSKTKEIEFPKIMLFLGEPGLGKTSFIYIITKLLTCDNLKLNDKGYYEPCNECEKCKNINNDRFVGDVEFIDCSMYGKAEVTALQKKALITPMFGGKNKIYILDEFQSLGNTSTKGAVLKLLEKKRNNVYFFLSAMSLDSITDRDIKKAIQRRCQIYNLKEVAYDILAEYLFNICMTVEEPIPEIFFTEGIHVIAQNSDGSPGIAISNLERCISGKLFSKQDIESELSFIDEEQIFIILQNLLQQSSEGLYSLLGLQNIENFYYKSKAILLNACVFKYTHKLKEEWKEVGARKLQGYSNNLLNLLKCYNINRSYYFDKDTFIQNVLDFYQTKVINNQAEIKTRVRKRI